MIDFLILFSIVLVIYQNIRENKFNSSNFANYIYRILFMVSADIFFDWVKVILIYKFSGFETKSLKRAAYELIAFQEKLKYNCFEANGSSSAHGPYCEKLEAFELTMVNVNQHSKYNKLIDQESVQCMELEHNVTVYCIFILSFIYNEMGLKVFCDIRFYLVVVSFLMLKHILRLIMANFLLQKLVKKDNDKKKV